MNLFPDAIAWILSPGGDIPLRIAEHLAYTFVSILLAAAIAIPVGFAIGHTGRGREIAVGLSGAARALPSFGLIILLVLLIGVVQAPLAAVLAFVVLGVPSILAGAYAGIESVDRRPIDAARSIGMTEWQILMKVEIPLGLPLLIAGIRSATLQIVATVTLAAYVGLGGMGVYIIKGLALRQFDQMLGSALLIAALALVLDGVFASLERIVVPRGVTAGRVKEFRTLSPRRRAAAGITRYPREG